MRNGYSWLKVQGHHSIMLGKTRQLAQEAEWVIGHLYSGSRSHTGSGGWLT